MGILPESQINRLKVDLSEKLVKPITLVVFTQEYECNYCKDTRELAQEVASLTDKIKVQVFDLVKDKVKADEFNIDKVPAIVLVGPRKSRVEFFGIPVGYEFSTLMKDIVQLSREATELSNETRQALTAIKTPVHIKIFVTPTCPYCPSVVSLAHQFAMENPHIRAEMIEISEFPQLAVKYNVMGVPKTVINETRELLGMQSEDEFLRQVTAASKPPSLTYG
jgi:glutaredoxin-like protein